MISINNLSIQFGRKHLFKNISVRISRQDRIGLVGVNGTGKSTLLKIIAGLIETDDGVLTRARQTTVGYLPQEVTSLTCDRTLYQETETAFADTLTLKKNLDDLNNELSKTDPGSPEFPSLLTRQGELQHRLDQSDFFRIKPMIEKVLAGLGFKEADFNRSCSTFSGGWLMRLMLAKLLLAEPAFLLLDEPTNHLDIESLTWLEDFLKTYNGALVIVSHDRAFLDNLSASTWELAMGNLNIYKGNYSSYLKEKECRLEVQRAAYANQQARIAQTKRFVERFRAKSTKASQVQSRIKQLEKMERIELDTTEKAISFRFPPPPPSGRQVLAVSGLKKIYDGRTIFDGISLQMQRGEKLAVVGANGAGKSTLAKLLAGQLIPDAGKIIPGHKVKISYFGQHQAQDLSPQLSVLETLSYAAEEQNITGIRSLLGAFLFRGDEVDKKVAVLSGGEKSRLALAKMIASPANLLIMDEPTNHLDMASQEILRRAMAVFDGTIIVVSHNRYFLNGFVNRVLEIKNGAATIFDGDLDYYLAKVQAAGGSGNMKDGGMLNQAGKTAPAGERPKQKAKEIKRTQAETRQRKSRQMAPFKKTAARAEEDIKKLEAGKAELEKILADPALYQDTQAFLEQSRKYEKLDADLGKKYREWEQALAELDRIEAEFQ